MVIKTLNSPNQSDRIHGADQVRIIVAHTPQGGYAGSVNYCMNPSADVSYHLLIKRDGTEATQLVPWSRKAWHAKSYNSISDGISVEGYAALFQLQDGGTKELAKAIAQRLIARKLLPQWTTDPMKGGFCRHGDLQSDRTDPTPDLVEWKLFVDMVKHQYDSLKTGGWPVPLPAWYWVWARWKMGVAEFKPYGPSYGPLRPAAAPKLIPLWAWRRLKKSIADSKL